MEFQKLLQVLEQYYAAVHTQPCTCGCSFCKNGNCDPDNNTKTFQTHYFMRHLLCEPTIVFENEGGRYSYYHWKCVTLQCENCYKNKDSNLLLCPKSKLWADANNPASGLTWEEYKRTDINLVNTSNYKGPAIKLAGAPKKKQFFNLFQVLECCSQIPMHLLCFAGAHLLFSLRAFSGGFRPKLPVHDNILIENAFCIQTPSTGTCPTRD